MDVVRRLRGALWVLFVALLALLGIADLVSSIIEIHLPLGRNHGALIAIAAVTFAVSVVALAAVVQALRGRRGRIGLDGAATLTSTALILTLFFEFAVYVSGPL
jgi:hypothetical protein